jgi:branched-chain amino acid transport system permease protein
VAYNKKALLIAGIIFVVLLLLPIGIASDYILNLLILFFLYIMVAQSWNLMGGFTGLINIGQSAFFGMGALFTRLIWITGVPIYIALLAGGVASVILACIIGIPALRLRGIYFPIGTLAVGVMLRYFVATILPGVSFLPAQELAVFSLVPRYYWALCLMAVTVLVVYLISKSKLGLAFFSIREDQEAAESAGVNTLKYKIISLCISTFLAGLAGGIFAFIATSYYYYVPFVSSWSLEPLLITFIGGVGTVLGPIIGAVFFVALKEIFALTMGDVSVLVFGALFILVVLFLPGGLVKIGSRVRQLFHIGRVSKKTA